MDVSSILLSFSFMKKPFLLYSLIFSLSCTSSYNYLAISFYTDKFNIFFNYYFLFLNKYRSINYPVKIKIMHIILSLKLLAIILATLPKASLF